ncbi:MAG: hypothetical protein AAF399_29845, partial [Bacteroidota bacterium]
MKRFLLIVSCCWWITSLSQTISEEFLPRHTQAVSLNPSDEGAAFPLLEGALAGYTFFFTAEEHWQAVNQRIAFRFLTYFYEAAGVRNLVVEGGYSYAFLINRYLETGKEPLLLRAIYDTPVCPVSQVSFFKQLYAFNQSSASEAPIKVMGVDLEHSPLLVTECLYQILPTKPLTAGVRDRINELKRMQEAEGYDEKEARRFYRQWHKEV